MVVQHEVMEQRLEVKEPPLMVMMKMLFVRAEELRWPLSLFLSIVGTGPEVADVARRRSLPSNPPARAPSRHGPTSSFDWARRALPVLGASLARKFSFLS